MKANNLEDKSKKKSVIALVLILISIILPFIGIILIIIGLVFAHKSRKLNKENNIALVSIILGYVFLAIQIIIYSIMIFSAIAAGLLIQQASELQQESLEVGRQAQERINADLEIIQISTEGTSDGILNGGVDKVSLVLQSGEGSQPIKFEDTFIKLDANNLVNFFLNDENNSATTSSYNVEYLITGNQHLNGYLTEGESAELTFIPDSKIVIEDQGRMIIRVVPKNSAIKIADITTNFGQNDIAYIYP